MGNFDYKKYLVENKLTLNSRLNENENTLQWPDAIRNFITTNLSSDEKELYLVVKALEKTLESFKNEMGEFDPDFHYINENINDSLENKIQQWANNNAGGYGPDEDDKNSFKFKDEMKTLLSNTLEDFNPDYYGDDTTMSPGEILEDFIDGAIDIIGNYTMDYYGDSTSFSPDDIKDEFYEFIGVAPNEFN